MGAKAVAVRPGPHTVYVILVGAMFNSVAQVMLLIARRIH